MAVHIVGSINIDIIASLERLPLPGETVMAGATAKLPGGKGANQAVAAARMGAQTRMIGAVGDGDAGRWMRDRLAADGIDVSGIEVLEGQETGTAYIAVDAEGENQIIVVSGANARLRPCAPVDEGVLLAQLEVPVATLLPVFAQSKAIRILNTAPAVAGARALFEHVDVLVLNEHELGVYVPADGDDDDLARRARSLLCRDGQAVVITLGANGALAVRSDWHLHVPAVPVIPVDTIGAGDCFCGALAALLDEGRCLEEALPCASAAAALCTLGQGAAPSMPTRAAVADLLLGTPTEHALPIKNASAASLG
ncbi:ribokinase [Novosphingobium mangrovi (ex Huang et al. 2023)]|uniref:Ribokinase n=1 Tax=Novosphingobium mangrovi (ex Huang et al. 2023) TaxID=2976432 RepID=A0ABT2I6M1_9SPHN|nr:ribokinase [Novosphingobium mangrovi (ex Huang et al. 2023)]MCT2400451.1 ribokinase [Novosphingobium mangrovi (ex Huang et al. 2023)]